MTDRDPDLVPHATDTVTSDGEGCSNSTRNGSHCGIRGRRTAAAQLVSVWRTITCPRARLQVVHVRCPRSPRQRFGLRALLRASFRESSGGCHLNHNCEAFAIFAMCTLPGPSLTMVVNRFPWLIDNVVNDCKWYWERC